MSGRGCNVCGAALAAPIYVSSGEVSITSLCEVLRGRTEVYWCGRCGHLQTPELQNLQAYYDQDYRILIDSEEEDQLYEIGAAGQTFRADHQLHTLLQKVPTPQGAAVLDYGCAKGATLRRLTQLRPDILAHLFDVSDMYLRFWERFSTPDRWATHRTRPEWENRFDLVTSFYALEHIADPRAAAAEMARVLRPGGILYLVVPDPYQNPGDMVVVDHVNHFSSASLHRLLAGAGLRVRTIDAGAHQSALVAVAEKAAGIQRVAEAPPPELAAQARATAAYWDGFAARVRSFEEGGAGAAAIYGSGFYGTFIATCLAHLALVRAFLDQNPFRQGKTLLGLPIIAPDALPQDVRALYVGLNPRVAHAEIAKVPALQERQLATFWP